MEREIERSKVVVRWIVAAAAFAAVAYLKGQDAIDVSWATILVLTAILVVLNLIYWAILRTGAPRWLKYATTAGDLAIVSVLVLHTGAAASVFYYTYFIILVSNSIRYGMGMAVYVATIYNVGYVLVLLVHPPAGDLTVEAVKILAFWGVALYAGYLSMRFQRQLRILESYEETIEQLRAEVSRRGA